MKLSLLPALLLPLLAACASTPFGTSASSERIWHVKAVRPDGRLLDVKAIALDGEIIDVKAIETPGNLHLMDVKALRDGEKLPIKVIAGDDGEVGPIRTILADGTTLPIEAIDLDGTRYPVRVAGGAGNLHHVKAIGPGGAIWGVKAISPDGHLMDIKGVRMKSGPLETEIHGQPVLTHVKAIPQVCRYSDVERIWHVKAIHPEGRTIDIKAIAEDGRPLDVKAVERPGNLHVMDIKAIDGDESLPVKLLLDEGRQSPVVAIRPDGTILYVKALMPEGERFDVVGTRRSGNIIHIKVLGPGGATWGVKALSPDGFLHDVKGLKMTKREAEGVIHGHAIRAHVKALPQVIGSAH